jgi:hypothetical protein
MANYESRVFNVSQCIWDEGVEENIVTIYASSGTNTDESSSPRNKSPMSSSSHDSNDSSLSTSAIAGIAIGAVVAVALIALAIFFFLHRRKQNAGNEVEPSNLLSSASQSVSVLGSKDAEGNVLGKERTFRSVTLLEL